MQQPGESSENKYMAEIPMLMGCRAWGDTQAEALENLQDVATEFIRSFNELKQALPEEVEDAAYAISGSEDSQKVIVYL